MCVCACVFIWECVWVGGNGACVVGSGLSLLCRDLSTICQPAPDHCAWSCLMKTRCFPWLMLPSRTSLLHHRSSLTHINTQAAHLIKTLTFTVHTCVQTHIHVNKHIISMFPLHYIPSYHYYIIFFKNIHHHEPFSDLTSCYFDRDRKVRLVCIHFIKWRKLNQNFSFYASFIPF